MTEKEFQKELLSAFKEIGYSDYMIEEKNVSFSYKNGHQPHTAKAILYSSQFRKDSETAVIAVQDTQNANKLDIETEIKPYETLGTPIIILAEYRKLKVGSEPSIAIYDLVKEKVITTKAVVSFQEFKDYIKRNRDNFSPRKLEDKKVEPFQQKLPLFKTALELTNTELVQVYELGMKSIFRNEKEESHKNELYRNSLRLLAARILRDKANENWSLESASSLIRDAKNYNPNYFQIPPALLKKLDPLISEYLTSEFNFSHIGLETLGYFYEQAVLSSKVKQAQGIYYTPSIIAKTILKRMPIEEIRPENRILLDPTCGSGSFLVAGYERLTQMAYLKESPDVRHQRLIKSIFGNEKDPIAAEIAKLTLMLFHPPHKNNWNVFEVDAKSENFAKKIHAGVEKIAGKNKRPNIIVGNLPFKFEQTDKVKEFSVNSKRQGATIEGSAIILNYCLDMLEENGLIGIILPENILSHKHPKEIELRHKILREFQVLEQWKLPAGWFNEAKHPALVWVLKKGRVDSHNYVISQLSNLPVKEKEIPDKVKQKDISFSGTMKVDLNNLPKKFIFSKQNSLIDKIQFSKNRIKNYFHVPNRLRISEDRLLDKPAKNTDFIWIKNSIGTNSFTNLREQEKKVYLDILDNDSFPEKAHCKVTREFIKLKQPQVCFRVNRNNPELYNWSSIALIDIEQSSQSNIAVSSSFFPTFANDKNTALALEFILSLWIILNHPIASFYIRNLSNQKWISLEDDYYNYPLPDSWDDIEKIKHLASKAKQLLDLKRKYDSKYKSNYKANKNKPSKSLDELKNKILLLVKETDKMIYDMYGFSKSEIQQIEEFFGSEKRPGLDELGEDWKQFRPVQRRQRREPSIDPNELKDFGTSFETLEIDYDKLQVKLIINGLRDREDGIDVDKEGIWLAITPYMPGWMLRVGAIGMIYLKTYDSTLIEEYPEFLIKDFTLLKNAYKTDEEIDEALFGKDIIQDKKVG